AKTNLFSPTEGDDAIGQTDVRPAVARPKKVVEAAVIGPVEDVEQFTNELDATFAHDRERFRRAEIDITIAEPESLAARAIVRACPAGVNRAGDDAGRRAARQIKALREIEN